MAPLPPLAAGIRTGAMAPPNGMNWFPTVALPNVGGVSVPCSTLIAPVVRSACPVWAAASTFTASVAFAPTPRPVASSVSVALVPPAVAVAEEMETAASAIPSVTSSKLAAVTPPT